MNDFKDKIIELINELNLESASVLALENSELNKENSNVSDLLAFIAKNLMSESKSENFLEVIKENELNKEKDVYFREYDSLIVELSYFFSWFKENEIIVKHDIRRMPRPNLSKENKTRYICDRLSQDLLSESIDSFNSLCETMNVQVKRYIQYVVYLDELHKKSKWGIRKGSYLDYYNLLGDGTEILKKIDDLNDVRCKLKNNTDNEIRELKYESNLFANDNVSKYKEKLENKLNDIFNRHIC